MAHAILSPSGASRWLACTPSARFEQDFKDSSSIYAQEGTLAHSLGELLIKNKLGHYKKAEYKKQLAKIAEHEMYSESMHEYCDDYATFVMEKYAEAQAKTKDAQIFLEVKLDMTKYVPKGYGTSDVVIVADHTMMTIDLKYGKGVPVSVVENKQQMLYALGALDQYEFLYAIDNVEMTIYQPRIGNIESWSTTVKDLENWAENELKPKAQLAFDGKGEYVAGSHCGFCKGKATCKVLAEYNLELAKHEFKDANKLTDEAVSDIMNRTKMFVNWIEAVNDYALDQAVNHGKQWPGYKVVEGRSNRKYIDEAQVASKLLESGIKEDVIYTKKLLSITNMESELSKKVFGDLLGDLIIKPQGKPTLALESDKRPAFSSADSAKKDFE